MAALETSTQTDNLFGYTDEAVTKEVDKYKEDVNTQLSFKDAATFVAEATPIIGDALAAKEVYDELQKDDPNYLLVGALGGAALVGLIPGLGDAAASAIKTGAKKALDTAKRIEVDPNALGSMGGNINLKTDSTKEPKKKIRYRDDIDPEVYDAFEELADIQRGKPELAMVEAQNILSGGVLPYALEHTGDLTHRMAEKGGVYGSEYVAPKVDRLLNSLLSEYGFEKEMSENIASNARFKYENEKPNISFEQYKKEYQEAVNQALKKYAEEHKKVPVYNEMQLAGREAAVALGEGRYTDATENLYKIKMALNDKNYAEKSMQFNPEIDFRNKPKDFNKGGAVMNEQMEMAFMQQGGLKDDGMDQDPVSGNEVPSGSMAKEVRDDISAQISEGEYVVPADVVRYLGVKHFEDLRDKAKQGLQSMEANGRIGGEPVPVGGPQAAPMMQPPMPQMAMGGDLSPEEMNEINSIMMAQGGMVPTDPYQQQQMQYTQPMAQGAAEGADFSYYNPEGMTTEQAITTPTKFTGEFSFEEPVGITDTEVPVEDEASCEARGMVYNPDTKMCEVPLEPEVPVEVGGDDSDVTLDEEGEDLTSWMDNYDYTNFNNLAQQTSAALDGSSTMLGSAAEFIFGGGVLGKFAKASNAAQVAANIAVLKAQGQDVSELTTKFNNYVDSNNLGGFKSFITGKNLAKQINKTQIDVGLKRDSKDVFGNDIFKSDDDFNKQLQDNAPAGMVYTPEQGAYIRPEETSPAPSTSLRPPSRPSSATPVTTVPKKNDEPSATPTARDNGPSVAQRMQTRATEKQQEKAAKEAKEQSSPSYTGTSTKAKAASQKTASELESSYGLMNTGGLVSRPKKKK